MVDSKPVFGVCFVDTSIGTFHLGQFEDDRHNSSLFTLVAHYPPVQVSLNMLLQNCFPNLSGICESGCSLGISLQAIFELLSCYQVLYERRHVSDRTLQILNGPLSSALKEALAAESEFWSASDTLKNLAEGKYFEQDGKGHQWPQGLRPFISEGQ